jgi:hypothetical protein
MRNTLTEGAVVPLKSRSGNIIGYLRDVNSTRKEILSRSNIVLGFYNPQTDKTSTGSGNFLGFGDLRAVLLAGMLKESQGNAYDPDDFISSRSVGNKSNLVSNAPDYSDDVDAQLAEFDQDDVSTGLEYEVHRGIKRDSYRAKETVLKNLKQNPKWYNNPAFFVSAAGEAVDGSQDVNELTINLDDPEAWKPSKEKPRYLKPDSMDRLPPTKRELEKAAELNLLRKLGGTPNDLDEDVSNPKVQSKPGPSKLHNSAMGLLRDSIAKEYPNARTDSSRGCVTLKTEDYEAAFTPVNGFDQFSVFIKDRSGNQVEFQPSVNRKQLSLLLNKYYKGSKPTLKVNKDAINEIVGRKK